MWVEVEKEKTEFFQKNSVSLQFAGKKQEIIQMEEFKKAIKIYAPGGVSMAAMSSCSFTPYFSSKSETLS